MKWSWSYFERKLEDIDQESLNQVENLYQELKIKSNSTLQKTAGIEKCRYWRMEKHTFKSNCKSHQKLLEKGYEYYQDEGPSYWLLICVYDNLYQLYE